MNDTAGREITPCHPTRILMPIPIIAALGAAKIATTGAYILWRRHRAKSDKNEKSDIQSNNNEEDG
jgi:hypothetical protein